MYAPCVYVARVYVVYAFLNSLRHLFREHSADSELLAQQSREREKEQERKQDRGNNHKKQRMEMGTFEAWQVRVAQAHPTHPRHHTTHGTHNRPIDGRAFEALGMNRRHLKCVGCEDVGSVGGGGDPVSIGDP